jgi:hypothetical protein
MMLLILSCAKNNGKLSFTETSSGTLNLDSLAKQGEIALWSRSVGKDNNRRDLDANDSLDSYGKTSVPFYELSSMSNALKSTYFIMSQSSTQSRAPSFNQWSGKTVPWRNNADFKILMAYAHLSMARKYAVSLYPNLSFTNFTSIPVYAAEPGHPLDTGYGTDENGHVNFKFYSDNNSSRPPYATADESDAIYHELGHLLQHMKNQSVFFNLANADMNTLLEALSDVFAAGLVRDDDVFAYLEMNSPYYFSGQRTGNNHIRHFRHSLSFPAAYVDQMHLDGRVIAGALNDIRKYFQNKSISLINCSSNCQLNSPLPALSSGEAYDAMVKLAYDAYSRMTTNSTLYSYVKQLSQELRSNSMGQSLCSKIASANQASCKETLWQHTQYILMSRGLLYFTTEYPANSNIVENQQIKICPKLGAMSPTGGSSGTISSNEDLLVFPYIKNISAETNANNKVHFYDIKIKLKGYSGFSEVTYVSNGQTKTADFLVDSAKRETKIFGWMAPGKNSFDLMTSSISDWYKSQPTVGGSFGVYPSSSRAYYAYNWRVRAPSSGQASMQFEVKLKSFASDSITNEKTFNFTQTLSVGDSTYNQCN